MAEKKIVKKTAGKPVEKKAEKKVEGAVVPKVAVPVVAPKAVVPEVKGAAGGVNTKLAEARRKAQQQNRLALGKQLETGGTGAAWGKGDFGQLKSLDEKAEQHRKSVGKGGR